MHDKPQNRIFALQKLNYKLQLTNYKLLFFINLLTLICSLSVVVCSYKKTYDNPKQHDIRRRIAKGATCKWLQ